MYKKAQQLYINFRSIGLTENAGALITGGANVNAQNKRRETPLHLVGKNGKPDEHYAMVVLLAKNGADLNARNVDGKTPVHSVNLAKNRQSNISTIIKLF